MDVSVRIMEFLLEFHLAFHDAGIFPYIMERFPAVFHGMRSFFMYHGTISGEVPWYEEFFIYHGISGDVVP